MLAGILPGILTALILMLTVYIIARLRPDLAPLAENKERVSVYDSFLKIWPVPLIFGISMGGIYGGVFTPTEAGAVGAFLSLLFSVATRRLSWGMFVSAISKTARLTAMILFVVIGGKMFGFFLTLTQIPLEITNFIGGLAIQSILVVLIIFAVYFLLGMFMDEIAILVIMTPIMYPVVIGMGYDGAWFGILTIMMLLTGLLTPPVGLIGFIVSSITKIPAGKIFYSITPFWIALIFAIILVIAFPAIALVVPGMMR